MAKLCLFTLGWLPFLSAALCLLSPTQGDNVTSPTNVHFQLGFFAHILTWSHDKTTDDGILYEVDYLRYGSNWTSVPHCHHISHQYCDLTGETLPKSLGYYGRVRSILGNQTSEWSRTARYTFTEVNLPPPTVLLDVNGTLLHVELILPEITKDNITRNYKDIFHYNRVYTLKIRRTKDNHTFQHVKNVESFSISDLAESNEYCLSVQPSIASRQNIGEPSPEVCIYLGEYGLTSTTLLILAVCILSFLVLLICVNLFICLYIRGVVKTPKTLSLIQRSWSWMDKPPSPVIETTLSWETVLKDHLMTEPRDSPMRSSADSGFGSQFFINNLLKLSPESPERCADEHETSEPRMNSGFKEFSVQEEDLNRSLQGEDSGISLSTGSPTLKRTSSHTDTPYRGNALSCDDCREEVEVNVMLGYLKQLDPEKKPNSFKDGELENTWQPQIKDYLSQRPENLCKDKIDCNIFEEPWIQVPKTFQTPIPHTVAFSPFSRVLWDLGVSAPSLTDVELLDTRA
ncbi:interleukin-10 receptor subunit alpha isoform X2 [Dendropsophus ebraccatus]|uniref:interleukin-10 receptor subunit alpha isoform X2 n=1 Tax=Dendropsophus ebraccatus TaxID=150705 RepID=UPI0038311B3D